MNAHKVSNHQIEELQLGYSPTIDSDLDGPHDDSFDLY
jgi:hypothetical protein